MEGFIQSLKFPDPAEQVELCALIGLTAKQRGSHGDVRWRAAQTLWWQGVSYARQSLAYQQLIDRAYEAMLVQAPTFAWALIASGNRELIHTIGKHDPTQTTHTEAELCERLTVLRRRLLLQPLAYSRNCGPM